MSGQGDAAISPVRETYSAGSMVSLSLSPEAGYCPVLTLNGENVPLNGLHYSFGVKGDTLLSVSFAKCEQSAGKEPLFPEEARGNWVSADGNYRLSVGEHTLALTRDGSPLDVEVFSVYDPAYGGSEYFFLTTMGKRYELSFFGNRTALSLRSGEEVLVFMQEELPAHALPSAYYGVYSVGKDSPDAVGKTLTVNREGCFWGDEKLILLSVPSLGGQTPALAVAGGRVYALFLCRSDELFRYTIVLRDPLTGEEFQYV